MAALVCFACVAVAHAEQIQIFNGSPDLVLVTMNLPGGKVAQRGISAHSSCEPIVVDGAASTQLTVLDENAQGLGDIDYATSDPIELDTSAGVTVIVALLPTVDHAGYANVKVGDIQAYSGGSWVDTLTTEDVMLALLVAWFVAWCFTKGGRLALMA